MIAKADLVMYEGIMLPRRKLPPRPLPDNGVRLFHRGRGVFIFVTFDKLHEMAQQVMDPRNSVYAEQQLGKMHYTKDPTYHMRKTQNG